MQRGCSAAWRPATRTAAATSPLPPGAEPLALLELTTHAGHFIGQRRSRESCCLRARAAERSSATSARGIRCRPTWRCPTAWGATRRSAAFWGEGTPGPEPPAPARPAPPESCGRAGVPCLGHGHSRDDGSDHDAPMGESVTEGTVLEWLKQVGDRVEADEPLVEISTDKVDAEVPAPGGGNAHEDPGRARLDGAAWATVSARSRPTGRCAEPRRRRARRPRRARGRDLPADGRLGQRGHRARVAQGRRRQRGRRGAARRDLHRQGRRRGARRRWRARSRRSSSRPTRPSRWAPCCAASRPARAPAAPSRSRRAEEKRADCRRRPRRATASSTPRRWRCA